MTAFEIYETALKSIAANSCCAPCREAGLVAKAALRDARFDPARILKPDGSPATGSALGSSSSSNMVQETRIPAREDAADLLERLAAWDHGAWAGWTAYMLDNLTDENIARWRRQIATPYAELSEGEKDSDRKEAREIMGVVASGTATGSATDLDEQDSLHTGDDALLDALTGLRAGLDSLLEGEHGTMSAEQHEALGDIYEALNQADELRIAELTTAPSEIARLSFQLHEAQQENLRAEHEAGSLRRQLAAANAKGVAEQVTSLSSQLAGLRELLTEATGIIKILDWKDPHEAVDEFLERVAALHDAQTTRTAEDLTRIGEFGVQPAPQPASTDPKG